MPTGMSPNSALGAAGGAGLGFFNYLNTRNDQAKDANLRAAAARWSPWTHIDPNSIQVKKANLLNSEMQGISSGMSMGQSVDDANQRGDMNAAYTNYLQSQASPWGGMGGMPIQGAQALPIGLIG